MRRSRGCFLRTLTFARWHNSNICAFRARTRELATRAAQLESSRDLRDDDATKPAKRRGRPPKVKVEDRNDDGNVGAARKRSPSRNKAKPKSIAGPAPHNAEPQTPIRSRTTKPSRLPPRIAQPSKHHHDLNTFLAYATRVKLSKNTTVYAGTHYEYTVAHILSNFNFTLHRTGRSNDLGIDLVGHWKLPRRLEEGKRKTKKESWHEGRVLVQCKAYQPRPSNIRELEGAYAGAPAGWKGDDVLAFLVASKAATKGVRAALQRCRWPMGIMQVTRKGELRQMLWNAAAARAGLEGLGVTVRYENSSDRTGMREDGQIIKVKQRLALTWLGELWRTGSTAEPHV